jgi:hypothetical protein
MVPEITRRPAELLKAQESKQTPSSNEEINHGL